MTLAKLGVLALSFSITVACTTTDPVTGETRLDTTSTAAAVGVAALGAAAVVAARDDDGNDRDLQDLVGMRGSSGERELEDLGYDYRRTIKVRDSSIAYYWSSREQRCIAVTTKNGRYDAINDQPESACDDGGVDVGSSDRDLENLVGMRASSGERELDALGYRFMNSSKSRDRIWANWWNRAQRRCITVVTMDGRYDSVTESLPADCDRR